MAETEHVCPACKITWSCTQPECKDKPTCYECDEKEAEK